jgi:hypothetical protein
MKCLTVTASVLTGKPKLALEAGTLLACFSSRGNLNCVGVQFGIPVVEKCLDRNVSI